jgi:hypothetical protein
MDVMCTALESTYFWEVYKLLKWVIYATHDICIMDEYKTYESKYVSGLLLILCRYECILKCKLVTNCSNSFFFWISGQFSWDCDEAYVYDPNPCNAVTTS